ncbi:MAG: Co2+/Mg2+ efflux protein ApaG [Magnetococcales bacterium]|nr:Co2+/Mg2+ efflux protein ApaG [Magnetococcales bacterium]
MTPNKRLNISITTVTTHLDSRSDSSSGQYAFGYAITLTNTGSIPARLLRRHWFVKSDNGHIQEVQGEGVIGEQPYLLPGEEPFQYTSWAMLQTPTGHMEGRFQFETDDGEKIWQEVPPFFFEVPGSRVIN